MRLCVILLYFNFLPLFAQNAQIAGMQQDLAELRTEVDKLKLEIADLRAALNQQKVVKNPDVVSTDSLAKFRTETLKQVEKMLKLQSAEVNAALAELTRQVNAALAKPNVDTPSHQNNPTRGNSAPSDAMPQTGIMYRVKPGDSVIKIALRQGSKAEWILKANNLSTNSVLKAGVEIFVPQSETPNR